MKRRDAVRVLGASVGVALAGCVGGGSDVVETMQQQVSVTPGQGWVTELPDVSDPGGAIQYNVSANQRFDIYFFTSEESFMFYDTYTDGGDPARTPRGDDSISATATPAGDGSFRAATGENGGRESVNESGPYYFVVDHSDYRGGAVPSEQPTALDAFVEVTVTEKKFAL